jgi:methylated-DNA-[protein]-cysteine S-methyltransferase
MKTCDDGDYPITTPIGRVHIYYQTRPFLLAEIRLPVWKTDAGPVHPGAVHPVISTDIAALRQITELLSLYFSGTVVTPPWALFNMAGLTVLQQRVMRAVAAIPFGALKSYGHIAEVAGCARGGRFVGNTMARNPFPILVPCHRVVRCSGETGGFGGGPELKKRLIEFESKQDK